MLEILQYLGPNDLASVSNANKWSTNLANRFLWREFNIRGTSIPDIQARCRAIFRIPQRGQYIRRLGIGPCYWTWDPALLTLLSEVWPAIPNARELVLEGPPYGPDESKVFGGDLTPVIISLLDHGSHIQLHLLKYDAWLRPDSPLQHFLSSQPSLRTLIGVDVFAQRLPVLPPNFLPSLQALVCFLPATAILFTPSRPLRRIVIHEQIDGAEAVTRLVEAFEATQGVLAEVHINLARLARGDMIRLLTGPQAPNCTVRKLRAKGINLIETQYRPLELDLAFLEEIIIDTARRFVPGRASDIIAFAKELGPNVRYVQVLSPNQNTSWCKDESPISRWWRIMKQPEVGGLSKK
ncbi:hypothetical protein DL93DRAFT_2072839 [Clavulina sp. PMI_390]|nr:hypothetical protein DL93DRAFT_2072839 [Clavulina sp. PMI_390]